MFFGKVNLIIEGVPRGETQIKASPVGPVSPSVIALDLRLIKKKTKKG